MRSLMVMVMMVAALGGCLDREPETRLRDVRSLGLLFSPSENWVVAWVRGDPASGSCLYLASDVHAELDGVPMTIDRGAGDPCFFPELKGPHPGAGPHTLTLADSSRSFVLDLGEHLSPRTVTKVPAGPLALVGGATYSFQVSGVTGVAAQLDAVLRSGSEVIELAPVSSIRGMFELTMPMIDFTGTFEVSGSTPAETVMTGGVPCSFPAATVQTSAPITIQRP